MSLKHAMYMAEMKKRQAEKEKKNQPVNSQGHTAVKMRRHRLPR